MTIREPRGSQRLLASARNPSAGGCERYTPSVIAATCDEFPRLGLADAATREVIGTDAMLLTAEGALYGAALRSGRRAEPFSNLLAAAGLS